MANKKKEYLENVKTITADKTATKSQQEEIKQYNKLLLIYQ